MFHSFAVVELARQLVTYAALLLQNKLCHYTSNPKNKVVIPSYTFLSFPGLTGESNIVIMNFVQDLTPLSF
ncbi:hypothetical protein JXB22_01890 [candidate division WOR-3 bacterium]|nr:hypothetical protein [candidate division WOR-3 bacterium]